LTAAPLAQAALIQVWSWAELLAALPKKVQAEARKPLSLTRWMLEAELAFGLRRTDRRLRFSASRLEDSDSGPDLPARTEWMWPVEEMPPQCCSRSILQKAR